MTQIERVIRYRDEIRHPGRLTILSIGCRYVVAHGLAGDR